MTLMKTQTGQKRYFISHAISKFHMLLNLAKQEYCMVILIDPSWFLVVFLVRIH